MEAITAAPMPHVRFSRFMIGLRLSPWRWRRLGGWLARPVVGRRLADFKRSEIGRASGESVRDVRQHRPFVDGCRSGFEPEVERLGFIDFLHGRDVLRIELRY